MSFIDKIFSKKTEECPRCLGKGKIDESDIKRLQREFSWLPGKCAYCEGMGKVSQKMIDAVKADARYLSLGTTREERKRLFNGEPDAMQRARDFDLVFDRFCEQARYLHYNGGMSIEQIVEFYMISEPERQDRQKLSGLIGYVIEKSKN
ncbi:MAG: hypothetical protein ACJ77K_04330 [Bacteroidia bacterium]